MSDRADLFHVDAFARAPLLGNPAAVHLVSGERVSRARDAVWMQAVAAEMNLSETAFVALSSKSTAAGEIGLRWFTPRVEVDLCGHATLASAHVLWETGLLGASDPARFATRSGTLTVRRRADGWIEMDFPARTTQAIEPPDRLIEALGAQPRAVRRTSEGDVLVEVDDAETVRELAPDQALLGHLDARGIVVTAAADDGEHDFVSRFFAPAVGIPEDPVTGSAHCALGPYWGPRLKKETLRGYQASARGGVVEVTLRGERVLLAGQAVTVAAGRLCI